LETSAGTTEAQRHEASGQVEELMPTFDNINDELA
jgi:hypothetical protein